jgi:fluoride exporter
MQISDAGWVGLGGAVGAVARFAVSRWTLARFGAGFPVGTLLVNVSGSFVLGVLAGLLATRVGVPHGARLLLGVGFCGAYTTFSTFAVDTIALAQRPAALAAVGNVLINNALALAAALIGMVLAGRVSGGA